MHQYQLQNRYQDSGWENLPGENYMTLRVARYRAAELSENSIAYGMVRVVNLVTNEVITTFSAGGGELGKDW